MESLARQIHLPFLRRQPLASAAAAAAAAAVAVALACAGISSIHLWLVAAESSRRQTAREYQLVFLRAQPDRTMINLGRLLVSLLAHNLDQRRRRRRRRRSRCRLGASKGGP